MIIKNAVYSDLCSGYAYGKELLDLPSRVIEMIDEFFDNISEVDWNKYNPDNLYVNMLLIIDDNELCKYYGLSSDELNYEEVERRLSDDFYFLDYVDGVAYVIS